MPSFAACTSLPLNGDTLRDKDVAFHGSLVSLKRSADAGCPFCHLCFTALEQGTTTKAWTDALQARMPDPIYLNGAFDDTVHPEAVVDIGHTMGSRICVSVGRTHLGRLGEDSAATPDVLVYLNLCAQPATPAAKWIRGRRFTGVPGSFDSQFVAWAKHWLEGFTRWYRRCHGLGGSFMPTHLIHVGETSAQTRLVERLDVSKPYLALSYCWGGSHGLRLVEENLAELQSYTDEAALNSTSREAVEVARRLGIAYIWIDANCIVPGDADD